MVIKYFAEAALHPLALAAPWKLPNLLPTSRYLQIQLNHFPGDFKEIFRKLFFKSRRFIGDKPYNIKMQLKITVILLTRGLPYVQSTRNRLTCENYIANYKISQEHQQNSRRFPGFPGVEDTLYLRHCIADTLLIITIKYSYEKQNALQHASSTINSHLRQRTLSITTTA